MDRIIKEKKSVSRKLQETAKETERLKQELESLIASGIQGPEKPIFLLHSAHKLEENTRPTPRPPIKHKSEKDKHQEQKKDPVDKKIQAELRKQKLKELQQKATEIVQKNVDAKKRAQSKHRPQSTKLRSKSISNVAESVESSKRSSIIISCNSAKSLIRPQIPIDHLVQPEKQYLQVPQHHFKTTTDNLKKSKSEQSIPAINQEIVPAEVLPSKPPVEKLNWLEEQPQKDHFNFMNAVKKKLQFISTPKNLFSVDVGVQGEFQELSSPKCLNLDPNAVKHIELNGNLGLDSGNQCLDTAQDGTDTSKNISSICSESRSHPVDLNVNKIGQEHSPREITIEIKNNQGAIPKRSKVSDSQHLLRNVSLRSKNSDVEESYTSDFFSEISARQKSIFSIHTEKTKSYHTEKTRSFSSQNIIANKDAGNSVSQQPESTKSIRQSRKSSWELVMGDSGHFRNANKSQNTEPGEKPKSIKTSRSVSMKNVTLRQTDISNMDNHSKALNLKFELEIQLLTDFNETIHRLSEIEKTYESFRSNNEPQIIDTQNNRQESLKVIVSQENDQKSDILDLTSSESIWLNLTQSSDSTSQSQLQLEETYSEKDNSLYRGVGGAHLKMFERLIKDEDHRIEHWKKLLKVQEQALLDRTRGELVYLEMQRKELVKTGKLAEASSIKKKQRGILLKHQQERMEMQRLKQMQKEDARNRQVLLKKERNDIKEQLLADRGSRKVRHTTNRKKSVSGPLKVLDSSAICSDTLITENADQEAVSGTMSCMEITTGNEDTDLERLEPILAKKTAVTSVAVDDVKKTLLMRERALAKRRKTVEELLQWHKKLLEEEKAIEELEMKIRTIAVEAPIQEDKRTPLESQSILQYIPQQEEQQSEVTSANYSLDFDVESGQPDAEEQSNVSSISRLIENVNKVQDSILNSNVSFKSSVESPLEEDNIPEQVELEHSKEEAFSLVIAEPESEQAASSVDDIASVIIVEDPVVDTVVSEVQDTQSPTNQGSVIELSSDDSRSSEGFEEATNGLLSPKPDESHSVPVEEVIEETGNSSLSQESFENKTDEEKAASLSGKSQRVLPIRTRTLTETFEEDEASFEVTTVEEGASVDDESGPTPEPVELLTEEKKSSILTEAEELHRKQLAIEQEIKLLKEQQQKEAAVPFYLREIPDKPPPPYTPPSKSKTPTTPSVIPKTKEECEQIIEYCVKIIHKAYACGNLDNITISENTLNLIAKDIDKSCYKFVFDLCKEVAADHYTQCMEVAGPSWLRPERKPTLAQLKPLDSVGLKKLMQERVLTQLGFHQARPKVENSIIKWSKKNRDQVDEALVQEIQREDASWTNLDVDSALVKDRMVKELMEMMVQDTARAFKEAMSKKMANWQQ